IVITGTGHRTAKSFDDGASVAPVLHIEIGVSASNLPPVVNAGSDLTITLPASASLNGTASDTDGPSALALTWSKVSGPGTVAFGNSHAEDTPASFSLAGTYVLRLTGNDGAASQSDDVQVTVKASTSG